jgi:RNA polymerase sigma-70 factor (ECF subfamily)
VANPPGEEVDHEQALIYRIAGNLLVDHTRKKKSVSLDALVEDGLEPGHNPIHETKSRMELEQVLGVMDKLPAKHRDVLVMRYVQGLDPAEIATITGETSNVVSVRIHRGVKELKSLIQA